MSYFKKTGIALALALSLFVTTSFTPKRAEAIVAIASHGAAIPAIVVLCSSGGGYLSSFVGAGIVDLATNNGKAAAIVFLSFLALSTLALITGVVMLDENGQATMKYKKLDEKTAAAWGILPDEMESFNYDLPVINSMSQTMARSMIESGDFSFKNGQKQIENHVQDGDIARETYFAMEKISKAFSLALNSKFEKSRAAALH